MRRQKMSRKSGRKLFKKTANSTHGKNTARRSMRGGFRM